MKTRKIHHSLPQFNSLPGILLPKLLIRVGIVLTALLLLTLSTTSVRAAENTDPFVGMNRSVHQFNKVVDSVFLKPLARTYDRLTPRFAKRRISNVLSNIDDVVVTINDLLQFKLGQASSDIGRVTINSTLGLGGLFNVAGNVFDLKKHDEDFGQTLAYWGVGPGPYLVLPLLGPSTLREGAGLLTDSLVNPGLSNKQLRVRDKVIAVSAVVTRAELLNFDEFIIGDDYLFMRELYLQNLEYREADGNLLVAFEDF